MKHQQRQPKDCAHRDGSVLIVVLFVMGVFSALTLSGAYRAGLDYRASRDRAVELRLRLHAESAWAVAYHRLLENIEANDYDALPEPWKAHAPLADEGWLSEWADGGAGRGTGGSARRYVTDYDVIDEQGKLLIAQASSAALETLGYSREQAATLRDWQDEDRTPGAGGAEDGHYARRTPPIRSKNAPLQRIDELALIRGFGPAAYARWSDDGSEPPPTRTVGSDDTPAAVTGDVTRLTTLGDGKINLNTAPEPVLRTLPIPDAAVRGLLSYRDYDPRSGRPLDDHVLQNAEDLTRVSGLNERDVDVLSAAGVFRSTHFRVFVRAQDRRTGMNQHLEALVTVNESGGLGVLSWHRRAGS